MSLHSCSISQVLDTRFIGGVAELLRRSVSNLARSTRVGSNPVVETTNHKPTQLSILPRLVNE